MLSSLLSFIPNLLAAYKSKSLTKSSELWVGGAAVLAGVAEHQKWIAPGDYQTFIAPAIVYTVSRVISKGVAGAGS